MVMVGISLLVAGHVEGGFYRCGPKGWLARHMDHIVAHGALDNAEALLLRGVWRYRARHPLDINARNRTALLALRIATPAQVDALHHYIQSQGPLAGVQELQALPGWETTTVRLILPFVTVHEGWGRRLLAAKPQQSFSLFLAPQGCCRTFKKYLGDSSQLLVRYRRSSSRGFGRHQGAV